MASRFIQYPARRPFNLLGALRVPGRSAPLALGESMLFDPTPIVITLQTGAFALSGQSAGVKISRTLSMAAGSLALTGVAVNAKVSRTLSMTAGAFVFAGTGTGFTLSSLTVPDTPGEVFAAVAIQNNATGRAAALTIQTVTAAAFGSVQGSGRQQNQLTVNGSQVNVVTVRSAKQ